MSFAKVRKAAEYLGLPLSRFAACIEDHVGYSITTSSEDELDELHAAWAATDDDDEYIGTIIRNGKFHEETA